MLVGFGFSIADVIAGIALLKESIKAVDGDQGLPRTAGILSMSLVSTINYL